MTLRRKRNHHVLLAGEFVLLESGHKLRGQSERSQTEGALGGAADIVHEGHSSLVQLLLVVVLVLDDVHVDEVPHVRAGIPPNVVRIDVDFSQHLDHLILVDSVRLGSGRRSRSILGRGIQMGLWGCLDDRERETVGQLEVALDVHADEGTGRWGRETLGAMFDDFHHHLENSHLRIGTALLLVRPGSKYEDSYQRLNLDRLERSFFPATC